MRMRIHVTLRSSLMVKRPTPPVNAKRKRVENAEERPINKFAKGAKYVKKKLVFVRSKLGEQCKNRRIRFFMCVRVCKCQTAKKRIKGEGAN